MAKDNIEIVQRLFEIAQNQLSYSLEPKPFKEEHIFLSNVLNCALQDAEREFNENFKECVAHYKVNLEKSKSKKGFFHNVEKLFWGKNKINQLLYIIYGDRFTMTELTFKREHPDPYKDLIEQIDRTALMTP